MRFLNTIDRPVQSWMTDRAFCFCLVLAILMISVVVISPDDSEGVVLAKVMEVAKEIRSGDKKRGAAPAGGRAALWSAGGCFCCRRPGGGLPFWVPEMQGGKAAAGGGGAVGGGQGGGVMGCRGWLGGQCSGGDLRRQFG